MTRHFLQCLIFFSLLAWPTVGMALSKSEAEKILGDRAPKAGMLLGEYNGISLIGLPSPPGEIFDVPIVKPDKALKVISEALALIESKSSFSKAQINRLKKRGPVTIVYDPLYPKRKSNMASVQVALFAPHFFKTSGLYEKNGSFLVIVSRHGVKWPLEELAAVMVHELVGHGVQHLNDRWSDMRLIDMECEAWLYEEMAYQNLDMDKFSNEMIGFKKQLEGQCDSFLRYLRKNDAEGLALWQTLNPDVPKLLKHFAVYLKSL